MVLHQAPSPHPDPCRAAIFAEHVAIKPIVAVVEESAHVVIAALCDMVRMTGDDNMGEAGHAVMSLRKRYKSI